VKPNRRLVARVKQVKAKRPRTVLDHILSHGHITTQELRDIYGYNHPPRAARDVRELGFVLETFRVEGSDGRMIAAYRFAPKPIRRRGLQGRRAFPRAFKQTLLEARGYRCRICYAHMDGRYLQVDHRVPLEIAGEGSSAELRPEDFMLVCSSCNRAKSWSCEHYPNREAARSVRTCNACYWANPEHHTHVATVPERRLTLVLRGADGICLHERLRAVAKKARIDVHEMLIAILPQALQLVADTQSQKLSSRGVVTAGPREANAD